jgi:intracellular sulfur oxidation DsrE/DsrF family protein
MLIDAARRRFMRNSFVVALLAPFATRAAVSDPAGSAREAEATPAAAPRVPHRVVYQCNKGDVGYYRSILFSVGQMKEKHGDDIDIVVTAYGPGIHILAKSPKREVPPDVLEKLGYLELFGVQFHACGNTMHALGWGPKDMLDFVEVVPIGAEDLMLLQEQGYAYLAW